MSVKTYFRHKITGKVSALPAHYADHPVLGKQLVEVDPSEYSCVDCGLPDPVVIDEQVDLVIKPLDTPKDNKKKGSKNG